MLNNEDFPLICVNVSFLKYSMIKNALSELASKLHKYNLMSFGTKGCVTTLLKDFVWGVCVLTIGRKLGNTSDCLGSNSESELSYTLFMARDYGKESVELTCV